MLKHAYTRAGDAAIRLADVSALIFSLPIAARVLERFGPQADKVAAEAAAFPVEIALLLWVASAWFHRVYDERPRAGSRSLVRIGRALAVVALLFLTGAAIDPRFARRPRPAGRLRRHRLRPASPPSGPPSAWSPSPPAAAATASAATPWSAPPPRVARWWRPWRRTRSGASTSPASSPWAAAVAPAAARRWAAWPTWGASSRRRSSTRSSSPCPASSSSSSSRPCSSARSRASRSASPSTCSASARPACASPC